MLTAKPFCQLYDKRQQTHINEVLKTKLQFY